NVIGAEANAEAAQRCTCILIERADLFGHVATVQNTEVFGELECQTTGGTGKALGIAEIEERLQLAFDLEVDEALTARGNLVAGWAGQLLVSEQHQTRLQHIIRGNKRTNGRAKPTQDAIRCKGEIAIRSGCKPFGAQLEFCGQRLQRGSLDGARVLSFGSPIRCEAESLH